MKNNINKIELDNSQRIFWLNVNGWSTRSHFINLKHIPEHLEYYKDEARNGDVTIKECWNGKFKKISNKRLNEMFEANEINFKIN